MPVTRHLPTWVTTPRRRAMPAPLPVVVPAAPSVAGRADPGERHG
jgi:hypothetical protein